MSHFKLTHATGKLLLIALALTSTAPAFASIPVTVSDTDSWVFAGVQKTFRAQGSAGFFLGNGFDPVDSLFEMSLAAPQGGQVNAIFPGQGGTTVFVDTGDQILFDFSFPGLLFEITITDIDPLNDYGGTLGSQIVRTAIIDMSGSGQGVADISLPNLGLLSNTSSMSGQLAFAGGSGLQIPVGDLNGDGTPDIYQIFDMIFAGFGPTSPAFDYFESGNPAMDVEVSLDQSFAAVTLNSSHAINPSGGLTLDVTGWSTTQTIDFAAVPIPPALYLFATGLLALIRIGRRKNP